MHRRVFLGLLAGSPALARAGERRSRQDPAKERLPEKPPDKPPLSDREKREADLRQAVRASLESATSRSPLFRILPVQEVQSPWVMAWEDVCIGDPLALPENCRDCSWFQYMIRTPSYRESLVVQEGRERQQLSFLMERQVMRMETAGWDLLLTGRVASAPHSATATQAIHRLRMLSDASPLLLASLHQRNLRLCVQRSGLRETLEDWTVYMNSRTSQMLNREWRIAQVRTPLRLEIYDGEWFDEQGQPHDYLPDGKVVSILPPSRMPTGAYRLLDTVDNPGVTGSCLRLFADAGGERLALGHVGCAVLYSSASVIAAEIT